MLALCCMRVRRRVASRSAAAAYHCCMLQCAGWRIALVATTVAMHNLANIALEAITTRPIWSDLPHFHPENDHGWATYAWLQQLNAACSTDTTW